MTASVRGTPSYALPATQDTAPVHEFRCLYTHDVRKKVKKWHDGSAKFHTFNKRVMLYDDTKNFIGDQHYRADEEFSEGIELQLDRGVLVEIGERIGETQTDLTGLVNKPHRDIIDHSNSSPFARPQPIQRTNNLNSLGRPKSLMEVLGATQGRSGRAYLPQHSPFEQRQILLETQHVEPPSKKRKIGSGKENDCYMGKDNGSLQSVTRSPRQASNILPPTRVERLNEPHTRAPVLLSNVGAIRSIIDLSSDDDVQQGIRTEPNISRKARSSRPAQKPRRELSALEHESSKKKRIRGANNGKSDHPPQSSTGRLKDTSPSRSTPVASISSTNRNLKPGMSSLKMKSQEPRRKLMYKALLPSSMNSEKEIQKSRAPQVDHERDLNPQDPALETTQLFSSGEPSSMSEIQGVEPQLSPSRPRPVAEEIHKTPQRSDLPAETVAPSPLFVSQSWSQQSPGPTTTMIDDTCDVSFTQEALQIHDSDTEIPIQDDAERTNSNDNISRTESPCFPQPPRSNTVLQSSPIVVVPALPNASILLPSVATFSNQQTPSKKSRAFARSLSENDPPLPNDPRAVPSPLPKRLEPIEESPIITSRQNPPLLCPLPLPPFPRPQKASPVKSTLQRSHSDTAAIIPTTVVVPTPLHTTKEQGPWTTLEAFLLFDKWPACKEKNKPIFEPLSVTNDNDFLPDSDLDDDRIDLAPVLRQVKPVLIRSARSFLRDG